jgi:hypothetical protein
MLAFEAAEMWCFVRYLSVAIGPVIAKDEPAWLLYLHLRQILDILFASKIRVQELDLLRVLIAEYLEMRCALFPSETLKNKHHHLIHYPRLIQLMGPMINYWCMRYEQKHQRYKRLMHISNNFKNVPKTIAARHQHDVASRLLTVCTAETLSCNGNQVMLFQLVNGSDIDSVLGGGCLYMSFLHCNSVTVNGTLYKCGCYLVTGVNAETGMPQLVQLNDILIRDQTVVIFFCEKLTTLHFDEHFHAWSVERCFPKKYVHIAPNDLEYFLPHSLHSVNAEMRN